MKVTPLAIAEILLIEPQVFGDDRGYFFESFNRRSFAAATGLDVDFVQDNQSRSMRGVLRGLHHQLPPRAQGKLVRVLGGEIFDVAADVRPESPSFGKWVAARLSAENRRQLWIPPGFAHGFLVLSEVAEVAYKASDYYAPELERTVAWNDTTLAIDWPLNGPPVVSAKDAAAAPLAAPVRQRDPGPDDAAQP